MCGIGVTLVVAIEEMPLLVHQDTGDQRKGRTVRASHGIGVDRPSCFDERRRRGEQLDGSIVQIDEGLDLRPTIAYPASLC